VQSKVVTSRDNPAYKRLKALASSAQARRKEGLSMIDGAHLVEACLAARLAPDMVAVSESGMKRAEVQRLARAAGVAVLKFPDKLFESLSNLEHGAGIVAAVATPRFGLPARVTADCLLLEHLQDPGNMGSILRSAAAAGVRQVFCSPATVYAWSPKVLRAGQGAHFALEIVEGVELGDVASRLAVPLLATAALAERSLYEADLVHPIAWVFGNEGAGVSREMLARAADRVSIPMPGQAESLNVAAACAICMFEAVRQRGRRKGGSS
jgi:TrmH family RNA methyltransferase